MPPLLPRSQARHNLSHLLILLVTLPCSLNASRSLPNPFSYLHTVHQLLINLPNLQTSTSHRIIANFFFIFFFCLACTHLHQSIWRLISKLCNRILKISSSFSKNKNQLDFHVHVNSEFNLMNYSTTAIVNSRPLRTSRSLTIKQ